MASIHTPQASVAYQWLIGGLLIVIAFVAEVLPDCSVTSIGRATRRLTEIQNQQMDALLEQRAGFASGRIEPLVVADRTISAADKKGCVPA